MRLGDLSQRSGLESRVRKLEEAEVFLPYCASQP
jgi:hypothetical protein